MISSDVISALKYWDSVGVLKFGKTEKNEYFIELYDDFESGNSTDKYEVKTTDEANEGEKKATHINSVIYSRADLMTAMQGNEKIKQLFTLSGQLLKKTLNTNDMNIIYMFYDYLKFPPEVIFLLLEYCVSIDKSNMRYIEKVALSWADSGINTVAKATSFMKRKTEEAEFEKKYKSMFKITGRDLTETEIKLLKSWVNDLKVSDELIKQAYETTVMNTGKVVFKYMDTVIRNLINGNSSIGQSRANNTHKKNAFQDYGSDGYDMELEMMQMQIIQEE